MRLILIFISFVAVSCTPFHPALEYIESENEKIGLGPSYLKKDQTLELRGSFDGRRFLIERIEVEEPDDEVEIKATLARVDVASAVVVVGEIAFTVVSESNFFTREGEPLHLTDLPPFLNAWVKAEGIERDGDLLLRKLQIRERMPDEPVELQGPVDAVDRKRRTLAVGGVEATYSDDVPILWDVQGVPPPPPEQRELASRVSAGLRRIKRRDEDDRRPEDQLILFDFVTVGGEVQYDIEWRDNHNLRNDRKRDRLIHGVSAKLELSFDIDENVFGFFQGKAAHDFVIFDQDRDFDFDEKLEIGEAFVLLTDLPVEGVAMQVGRQRIDQGREWIVDDELDALRLYFNFADSMLELSISEALFDTAPEEDHVTNYLAGFHIEPFAGSDSELFLYALYRKGGSLIDLDRLHLGASLEAQFGDFTLWFDGGYVVGEEDGLDVEGFGFDAHLMYVFRGTSWEPSVFAGIAFGSGDDDIDDGTDNNFRQTGLHDNNDKFNGVTSFRYLGELVRPEVSNIIVATFGFGFRPIRRTSVDVVFHHYSQVEPSPFPVRDSRLRLDPTGLHRTLGTEWDVIIGIESWDPIEVEIVLGYFHPGNAFGTTPDDAWFLTFQIEYNF